MRCRNLKRLLNLTHWKDVADKEIEQRRALNHLHQTRKLTEIIVPGTEEVQSLADEVRADMDNITGNTCRTKNKVYYGGL